MRWMRMLERSVAFDMLESFKQGSPLAGTYSAGTVLGFCDVSGTQVAWL